MYKYVGYVWPGMIRVTPEEARDIFKNDGPVFRLYSDNSEGMVDELSEIVDDGEYGIESTKFLSSDYLNRNQDKDGYVYFSHGTDDLNDLLELSKEFLECVRSVQREATQSELNRLIKRIEKYLPTDDMKAKQSVWSCVITVINGITPIGWQFGPFTNDGLDYVFKKEERITA